MVEVDGHIYAIGGIDGWRFLSTSEYTTIQADGSLAPWKKTTPLNEDRGFFGVAVHNGYVYAVGGGNGPNGHNLLRTVERAKLLKGGGLGPWEQEGQQLNIPRRCSKVLIMDGYLYAFGGYGGTLLDTIERTKINDDGTLGAWELLPESFTIPRYIHDMAKTDSGLYAIGGHAEKGGTGIASVEYAMLQSDGRLSGWKQATALAQGRYGLTSTAHDGYIYAMGGLNGASFYDLIERTRINNDGSLGSWETIAPLPAPFADIGVITYRNWVYVIGGTNREGYYDSVFMTDITELANPASFASKAAGVSTKVPMPSKPVLMINKGTVLEVIDGGAYAYIKIDLGGNKSEWVATGKSDVQAGDKVHYSPGIFMQNFYSKGLDRTFEIIRFVGKLEKLPEGFQ